jgi:hypothetical protein
MQRLACHSPGWWGRGMVDVLGIVFSSGIMFLVILRAVQMDALQSWFKPARTGTDSSGLRLRPQSPGDDTQATRREAARGGESRG